MLSSSVLAALLAAWAVFVPQVPTSAHTDGAVTWSARPADANGVDGRSWVDLDVDPGDSVQEYIAVDNYTDEPLTLSLETADGYFTNSGRFAMQPSSVASSGAGSWLDAPPAVTVPPGEQTVVPYRIEIPASAYPGDFLAGIAASLTAVSESDRDLTVTSRIGFRVMIRVSGELNSDLSVASTAQYSPSWNPFQPGRLDVVTTVRNTGNTRLQLEPSLTVSLAGLLPRQLPVDGSGELAPGETRVLTSEVSAVWPTFWVTLDTAVTGRNASKTDTPNVRAADSAVVVAIPWSHLVVVLLAAAFVWTWRRRRRRPAGVS